MRNTQWERIVSSVNGIGISTWKSMKLDPYFTPSVRINTKWIKDLNCKSPRRKYKGKALWHESWQRFHGYDIKSTEKIPKISKWDYVKIKSSCPTKETINRVKVQPMGEEKILPNHVSGVPSILRSKGEKEEQGKETKRREQRGRKEIKILWWSGSHVKRVSRKKEGWTVSNTGKSSKMNWPLDLAAWGFWWLLQEQFWWSSIDKEELIGVGWRENGRTDKITEHFFWGDLLQKGAKKLSNNMGKVSQCGVFLFSRWEKISCLCFIWKDSIEMENLMREKFLEKSLNG